MAQTMFPVDESSRVAEVRRAALAIARAEGLDEVLAGHGALVATEMCTNLVKHAQRGEVFLSPLSDHTGPGIEILSIDHGPGMSNVARCLEDGYSQGTSPGTGLGAIRRLSQEFDVYSQAAKGTVMVSRVYSESRGTARIGSVMKAMAGEDACGDAWAVCERDGALTLMVADGLGHGVDAARASSEAVWAFRRAKDLTPLRLLQQVHLALKSTRGAAVAAAHVDLADGRVRYSGIGNISGVISQGDKTSSMVSHNGTAGFHSPRMQEFSYAMPEGSLLIMHSDGLTTNWRLDRYPGLQKCHPSVIAGVLYRDATRQRDDVSVVVARLQGAA